jgi:branched-chain amino acid transport system substrate-binding protein
MKVATTGAAATRSCFLVAVRMFGLAGVVLATSFASAAAAIPATIKIGVTLPLSGAGVANGLDMRRGMQMALDEWNAHGGFRFGGRSVKVLGLFEDDQSQPAAGVGAAQKLITEDQVNFLIGDAFRSDVTLAVMDLASQFNVPIMSGESVSLGVESKITADPKKYANFFKGNWSSDSYADAIYGSYADLLKRKRLESKARTIAFVSEDTDYGRTIAKTTAAKFEAVGWKTVAVETIPLGTTDLYPQLTKFKDIAPAVVMGTFTSPDSGAALVKQFGELGLHATLIGVYFPTQPEFLSETGAKSDNLLWSSLSFDPRHNKSQSAFDRAVRKKTNMSADFDVASGYDSMNVALQAIQKAGSVDVAAIDGALLNGDWKGVIGRYVFDKRTHTMRAGVDYLPLTMAQIDNQTSYVIWPPKLKSHDFVAQPWVSR